MIELSALHIYRGTIFFVSDCNLEEVISLGPPPVSSHFVAQKRESLSQSNQCSLLVRRYRAGSGGGGGGGVGGGSSWVPEPPPAPKCTSVCFFLVFCTRAFFAFSCVSSILDYNIEQGKPRWIFKVIYCGGLF